MEGLSQVTSGPTGGKSAFPVLLRPAWPAGYLLVICWLSASDLGRTERAFLLRAAQFTCSACGEGIYLCVPMLVGREVICKSAGEILTEGDILTQNLLQCETSEEIFAPGH